VRTAVDPEHADALYNAFLSFDTDEAVDVAVFWGEGGAFCAGGVYNRRWGVPLTDGGTIRLPRLVGEGRALELIITGRKVDAEECLRIGLCEMVVPKGQARNAAENMAHWIARFPQASLRADRRSVYLQYGLTERAALETEWYNCTGTFKAEGAAGVARFARGDGRHGDFGDLARPRH